MEKYNLVATGMLLATFALAPQSAAAQSDGERVCQADGKVYRWSNIRNMWVNTYVNCAPENNMGQNGSTTNNNAGSDGAIYPGDEKCGPDGMILRFEGSSRRWVKTFRRCGS